MAKDIRQQIAKDLSAGKFAAAQKRARSLAKKDPANAAVQNFVGAVFGQSNMHRPSIGYFQAAVRAAPDNLEFRCNLILAMIMSDEVPKAGSMIDTQLKAHPKAAKLHYLRAFGHHRTQDHRAAINAANLALELDPQMIEALNIRGVAYSDLGQTELALADFQTILSLNPNDINALQNSAERLNELGRTADALARYNSLLKIIPDHGYALSKIATLCDADDLSFVTKTAQDRLARPKLLPDEKAALSMALAVALDRQGDSGAAMQLYDQVHAIDAKSRPYNAKTAWAEHKNILAQFPATSGHTVVSKSKATPIFVIGLPRSGTTLVEMILSAAPQVLACGEVTATERLYQDMFRDTPAVDVAQITEFAELYLDDLNEFTSDIVAFVDKMPANFRYVGLLLSAFPNGRIINVQRDPRAVALSLWKQRFNSAGMAYASTMAAIADQANLYRRYMAHWNAIYSEQIMSVSYERLVQDIEATSRQLAAHCGIDWSDAMTRPEKNTHTVRTASIHQVREKVHSRSVSGWVDAEDHLSAMTSRLDPALWPEVV